MHRNKDRGIIFICLIFCLQITSCADKNVIIKFTYHESAEEIVLPSRTKKFEIGGNKTDSIYKVEGLEKLKNLKYLSVGFGVYDLSFLKDVPNIEFLKMINLVPVLDKDILSYIKKVKTVYINGAKFDGYCIDLSENKSLKNLILSNIHPKDRQNGDNFRIINPPKALKMVDLWGVSFSKVSKEFLDCIIYVDKIILSERNKNDPVIEKYFKNNKNIYFGTGHNELKKSGYIYDLFD